MNTINASQAMPQVSSILTQGMQGRNSNRVDPVEPAKVAMEQELDMSRQRVASSESQLGRIVDISA